MCIVLFLLIYCFVACANLILYMSFILFIIIYVACIIYFCKLEHC